MQRKAREPRLRLPEKLASTAFRVAIAGTLACGATSQSRDVTADASVDAAADGAADALADVSDATSDAAPQPDAAPLDAPDEMADLDAPESLDGPTPTDACPMPDLYCGATVADASCPGPVCDLSECPMDAGCEPFV
jgi:hypothetical protein